MRFIMNFKKIINIFISVSPKRERGAMFIACDVGSKMLMEVECFAVSP